jgi:hypothetical protein
VLCSDACRAFEKAGAEPQKEQKKKQADKGPAALRTPAAKAVASAAPKAKVAELKWRVEALLSKRGPAGKGEGKSKGAPKAAVAKPKPKRLPIGKFRAPLGATVEVEFEGLGGFVGTVGRPSHSRAALCAWPTSDRSTFYGVPYEARTGGGAQGLMRLTIWVWRR